MKAIPLTEGLHGPGSRAYMTSFPMTSLHYLPFYVLSHIALAWIVDSGFWWRLALGLRP